jgi:hypothetical protein
MSKKESNNSEQDSAKHYIGDFLKHMKNSMEIPPQKPKTTSQDNSSDKGKKAK